MNKLPESAVEEMRQRLQRWRATFQSLGLHEQCGYISFETLVKDAGPMMHRP
jgi:hypothetical protein